MFQQGGFGPIPGQVHHFLTLDNEGDRRYGLERYSRETRRLYGVMDRRLAAHEFFADEPSIADFAILGWTWRHPRHKVDLAEFPTSQAERARLGEKGSAACRQLLARVPDSAEGHYYLAMNLGQIARTRGIGALKLVSEMEGEFKAALRVDEKIDYSGPNRSLGMLYRDAPSFASIGSRVKARQYLQRAIEVAPDFPENRMVMAESCVKWSDRNGLTREWKALEALLPEARRRLSGPEWEAAWADWDARLAELRQKAEAASKSLRAPRES